MTFSSLMLAFNSLIFKLVSNNNPFVVVSFWQNVGYFLVFLGFILFVKNVRDTFISITQIYKAKAFSINIVNQSLNTFAILSYNYALTIAPMALVNIVLGIQPVFVLVIGVFLTVFLPKISKEDISRKNTHSEGSFYIDHCYCNCSNSDLETFFLIFWIVANNIKAAIKTSMATKNRASI